MQGNILNNAKKTLGNETAWRMEDVTAVFDHLYAAKKTILGGDILNSDLSYSWDNWYYNPSPLLSIEENIVASYNTANNYIGNYAARNGYNYYVVVVWKD